MDYGDFGNVGIVWFFRKMLVQPIEAVGMLQQQWRELEDSQWEQGIEIENLSIKNDFTFLE